MQRKLKNHVKRRLEAFSSLDFYWERAFEELTQLGKKNEEIRKMLNYAHEHPKYS